METKFSEDSDAFSIHDNDSKTLEEVVKKEEEQMKDLEEVSRDEISRQDGDWLLVKLATKKTIEYFVTQIKETTELFVKFARSYTKLLCRSTLLHLTFVFISWKEVSKPTVTYFRYIQWLTHAMITKSIS